MHSVKDVNTGLHTEVVKVQSEAIAQHVTLYMSHYSII